MPRPFRLAILLFALGLALSPHLAASPCPDSLRLGLPGPAADSERLEGAITAFLADLFAQRGRCTDLRTLELRLAFGNGYELLDWLDSGALDGAILETPAIAVLERSRRPASATVLAPNRWLREIPLPAEVVALLPTGGETSWRSTSPQGFRSMTARELVAGLAAGREDLRIVTPWHLDASYLELLALGSSVASSVATEDTFCSRLLDATEISFSQTGAAAPAERHLVVPFPIAAGLWRTTAFRESTAELPEALAHLLDQKPQPPALTPLFELSEYFGTRPFSFRVDESLELLRRSPDPGLALVLPGGGVKAAYQSRLVDHLYGEGLLSNRSIGERPGSLAVESVVGTSGGALLGYFVARLTENGPWNLTDLLWMKGEGDGSRFLNSGDIFPGGDMLRYASVLVTFLVFSALLLIASFPNRSRLHPPETAHRADHHHTWRTRLTMGAAWFLFVIPLLVKAIHSDDLREHIPEIEGLIFALATFLAVSADQLLIRQPGARLALKRSSLWPAVALLVGGAVAILVPFLFGSSWKDGDAPFGLSFTALYLLLIVATVALLRVRRAHTRWHRRKVIAFAVEALVAALLVLLLHRWLGDLFKAWGEAGIVFSGFLLVAIVLVATEGLPQRFAKAGEGATAFFYLLLFSLVVFSLTRPEETSTGLLPWTAPSRLDLPLGALLVSLGALLVFAGLITLVHASDGRYRIADRRGFFAALLVAVVHVLLVHGTLVLMSMGDFSMLELTSAFWIRLLVAAAAAALIMIGAAWRWPDSSLARGLRYLAAFHPNGTLVHRRLSRFGGIALLAFLWWNLTVAPALYGNRQAVDYLAGAIARFDRAQDDQTARLTADFIVPTNVLDDPAGGTRLFLFSPGRAKNLSPPVGSGTQWSSIGTDFADGRVGDPRVLRHRDVLERVIMASGSPFPIFPATRVAGLPGRPQEEAMVDGGFSNLVPIEAALTAGARQVLILHSTHPLGHASAKGRTEPREGERRESLRGELFLNLERLPGYLFERSQRTDRVRRRELLVVSLAPPQSHRDWPPLFDFRESTVERMTTTAEQDLAGRIGLVESWGQPRFQASRRLTKGPTG
ncbi:MAG: hypothetical protein AAF604_06720 [Acidobacteriota bacterium]